MKEAAGAFEKKKPEDPKTNPESSPTKSET
jgi:hypothetical protein